MHEITLCDVGPRDGLQSEKRMFSVAERIELIDRLSAAKVPVIEAVSFVNPKKVPQMAEPEQVLAGIQRRAGTRIAGLALNERGADRAIAAGVDELRFAVMASESFNRRNQGVDVWDNVAMFERITQRVKDAGIRCVGVIGTAFGCPFEGPIDEQRVVEIARRMALAGADEISVADTIGSAVPNQVKSRFLAVREVVGNDLPLGCHFHNTRNTGFANAYAALDVGVSVFDASVGGLGGCPFAPRATGNIASEDLIHMLRNMGVETGVDLAALVEVAEWLQPFFPAPLPGLVMKAGLFPEVAQSYLAASA
ncbi:MAG: hydroxymethylglutaryl-CoA lyase [Gammaproteobacteria bacterium]